MSTEPIYAWTRFIRSSNADLGNSVSIASDGAIYIAGVTDFIEGEGIETWSGDSFVSKYNSDGTNEWIKILDSPAYDSATSISTSTDGAIYISGYTSGSFDGQTNNGNGDAYISKYNSDGTNAWIRLLGSTGFDRAHSISAAANGAIYITGSADGSFDGETINQNPSPGRSTDAFISKYNGDGTREWTRLLGSIERDSASSISTTSNGEIYITGFTYGSFDGQIKQTRNGDQEFDHSDAFITKYLGDGTKVWTRFLGSELGEFANSIATTNDGAIYVAGYTFGSFNGQTNNGNGDAYISKYNSDGTNAWTRFLGSSNFDGANSVSTDADGYIYITGETYGSFDGQIYTGGAEEGNFFIAKYDPNGVKSWTKFLPSSNLYRGNEIASSPGGFVYITGNAYESLDGQIIAGKSDAFIGKLDILGSSVSSSQAGPVTVTGETPSTPPAETTTTPPTTPVTPTPTQDSPVLGIQSQATVITIELSTPLVLNNLQVTKCLVGTPQSDVITGSEEGEAITGGQGKDQMTGGGGPDAFVFETPGEFGKKSADIITDFNPDQGDKVVIASDAFKGASKFKFTSFTGKVNAKDAALSNRNFIYDGKKGILYFNENGKKDGFGVGGEFARLLGAPELSKSDFVIV
jgi:hypothetical protein